MTFNLDKNDGAKSSTKFDLSKSNTPTASDATGKNSRSRTWLFIIPALLAIGIAVWYFLPKSNPDNTESVSEVLSTNSNTTDTSAGDPNKIVSSIGDSLAGVENDPTGSPSTATNSNSTPVNNTNTISAESSSGISNKIPATFLKGSNSISNLNQSLVKDIINYLKKNPTAIITVNGYASSEGEFAFNQRISQSRADAFKDYLIAKGIDGSRINASGKGIDNPVSSNETEDGRIKNRRVEILFQ